MAPLMIGLAFISDTFVRVLLTEKWLPCVPYLLIFCIVYLFYPIHTANLNAIKAMGRSDTFLVLEIIKKVIGVVTMLITMNISVLAMAYGMLITSFLCQVINSFPNRKLLNYKYFEQLKDIIPYIILATVMGILIYPFNKLGLPNMIILLLQIVIGGLFYVLASKHLKFDSYQYVVSVIKGYIGRKEFKN